MQVRRAGTSGRPRGERRLRLTDAHCVCPCISLAPLLYLLPVSRSLSACPVSVSFSVSFSPLSSLSFVLLPSFFSDGSNIFFPLRPS